MPRRYRPPTRRRKSKKQGLSQDPPPPSYQGAVTPIPSADRPPAAQSPSRQAVGGARHISRDHGYVVDEVRRIAIIVAFIMAGLVITAILR